MEKSLRGTLAFCLWKVGFILITDILITSVGHYIHISNAWSYGNVRVPCWEWVQRVLHVVLFLPKNCPVMFLMASGLCVTGPSVWGQRDSYPGMAPSRAFSGPQNRSKQLSQKLVLRDP